jgi:5'/3'-nucleotidase
MSAPMRILVCNDDGIGSAGLRLLVEAARGLADDVWAVAPDRKWTAAGHQLSFDRDLTLTRTAERTYACSGAPVDCVVAAMTLLFDGASRPDLVLSGVNDKRNVGEDLAYSGTMAIAREAVFWGIPALALSGVGWGADIGTQAAQLSRILSAAWRTRGDWAGDGRWLSINLPVTLPAPVERAQVARDKIASACEVVERTDDRIVFRIRRGRPGTREPGDENDRIDAGCVAVVRHRWHCDEALPDSVLAALRKAMGQN